MTEAIGIGIESSNRTDAQRLEFDQRKLDFEIQALKYRQQHDEKLMLEQQQHIQQQQQQTMLLHQQLISMMEQIAKKL